MREFNYLWSLRDTHFTKDKGKVFSCFSGGGGSTMGYKLVGFDVIGCCEIDRRMIEVYKENHNPKYTFEMPIQDFVKLKEYPEELYHLDILDGSPPCSTFSISGNREKDWGKNKKFREGQKEQVLDTLFFDFIELAKKLQPKVVIAENVKGLLLGRAIQYVNRIYKAFDYAGYTCQHWIIRGVDIGLPQKRERVFFVCLRKDLAEPFLEPINIIEEKPILNLDFCDEKPIVFGEIADDIKDYKGRKIESEKLMYRWEHREYGDIDMSTVSIREIGKKLGFNTQYAYFDKVLPTVTGHEDSIVRFDIPHYLSKTEVCKASSFPLDYNFLKVKPHYVCGMSVPPIMMANVVKRVYDQWLSKIK